MRRFLGKIGIVIVFVLVILVVLFLVFRPNIGQFAVVNATNNDMIILVEDRRNGSYILWTENVQVEGFCIKDETEWVEVARLLSSMKLYPEFTYVTINEGEFQGVWKTCDKESPGITIYRVTSMNISLDAQDNLTARQRERLEPYDFLTLPPQVEQ